MTTPAGHAYEDVIDAIDWEFVAQSTSLVLTSRIIDILLEEINWGQISAHPNALQPKYDYAKIKKDNDWLCREINERLFHPARIQQWLEAGNEIEDYLE